MPDTGLSLDVSYRKDVKYNTEKNSKYDTEQMLKLRGAKPLYHEAKALPSHEPEQMFKL